MLTPELTPKIIEHFKLITRGFINDGFIKELPIFESEDKSLMVTAYDDGIDGGGINTIEEIGCLRLIFKRRDINKRIWTQHVKVTAMDEDTFIEVADDLIAKFKSIHTPYEQ